MATVLGSIACVCSSRRVITFITLAMLGNTASSTPYAMPLAPRPCQGPPSPLIWRGRVGEGGTDEETTSCPPIAERGTPCPSAPPRALAGHLMGMSPPRRGWSQRPKGTCIEHPRRASGSSPATLGVLDGSRASWPRAVVYKEWFRKSPLGDKSPWALPPFPEGSWAGPFLIRPSRTSCAPGA